MARTFKRDHEDDEEPHSAPDCPACGGEGVLLGSLGPKHWHRCRTCGWEYAHGRSHATEVA